MKAVVFDIQRNSMQDGPGIRTTVFLKGCCMRCAWCHNPESFETQPVTARLPNGIIRTWGREMEAEEVFKAVLPDMEFYRASGGGVTLSGGEPALSPGFSAKLFRMCASVGIHTAMETNGLPDWKNYEALLPDTDLFLFDYKMTDAEAHRRWTGADNRLVLDNLRRIVRAGKRVILRCPVIPGVNDDETHLKGIVALVREYDVNCQIMPYHGTAADKWKALGLRNILEKTPAMEEKAVIAILERLKVLGCPAGRISMV